MNYPTKRCFDLLEDRGTMYYCPVHNRLLEDEEVINVWLEMAEKNKGFYCTDCKHLHKDEISCLAFPEVIPQPFLKGIERHTKKKYGQKNEVVFEATPV